MTHGRTIDYQRGCRCVPCMNAVADAQSRFRSDRASERVLIDGIWYHPNAPHGTHSGYVYWKCRCDSCKEVQRVVMANYRAAKRGASA